MKFHLFLIALSLSFSSILFAQTPAGVVPRFTLHELNRAHFTDENIDKNKPLFFFFLEPGCGHCHLAGYEDNPETVFRTLKTIQTPVK